MTQLEKIKKEIADFTSKRNWDQHHTLKNLVMSISIEAAELMEIFQWDNPSVYSVLSSPELNKSVRHELADVLIYLIRMADKLDIDLYEAVMKKMEINRVKWDVDMINKTGAYKKDQLNGKQD